MIEALIAGKLVGQPTERTAQSNGKRFVVAKLRAPMAEGESLFVGVVAFADHVKTALLALGDGDGIALAGTLKVSTWTNAEGVTHPRADLVANDLLTVHHARRKRQAVTGEAEKGSDLEPFRKRSAPAQGSFHDDDL